MIALYNHYPSPIAFEQSTLLPKLKKTYAALTSRSLIKPGAHLETIQEIEFNLINDETICDLHAQFMDDPTPTDVITFHHGEVFISYDTALREADERTIPLAEELFRYHVHGLLHLAGYDDLSEPEYTEMHALQESLISEFY